VAGLSNSDPLLPIDARRTVRARTKKAELLGIRREGARLTVGGGNEPRRVFLQVTLDANWHRNSPHFSVPPCREKRSAHVHHFRATFWTLDRGTRGKFIAEFIEFGLDIRLRHGLQRIVPSPQKFDCAILHTAYQVIIRVCHSKDRKRLATSCDVDVRRPYFSSAVDLARRRAASSISR
jgi:hypothetical protein